MYHQIITMKRQLSLAEHSQTLSHHIEGDYNSPDEARKAAYREADKRGHEFVTITTAGKAEFSDKASDRWIRLPG